MPSLDYSTDLGGIVRYLRGHAEAQLYDAKRDPDLRADLLQRCFGSRGQGFRYKRDKKGQDDWVGFSVARVKLRCTPLRVALLGGAPTICVDCEDLDAYFTAAALLAGYEWADLCITHPSPNDEGHCWAIIGPLSPHREDFGLDLPAPGIWDPSVWSGMGAPPDSFYTHPNTVRLRIRSD